LVATIQKQPMGDWFLTVAAALEYMFYKPEHAQVSDANEEEDQDDEPLDEEERDAKAREEAGADWMVEQGFDRKE